MGCRTRVIDNCCGPEETDGQAQFELYLINLPRLAIRAKGDLDQFFKNVDEMVELVVQPICFIGIMYRLTASEGYAFLDGSSFI